ncbi:ceramide synthase 2-like [Procambarus clarkii]|uniref:ceramide synthase 2-like n=1 Tax=Procambarus clarkii TaxID=6728 RepID=UPI0037430F5D
MVKVVVIVGNPSGGTLSHLVQSVTVVNPSGGTLSLLVQSVTVVNPSGGTLSHLVQSVTVVNPSGGTLSHLVQSVTVVNPSGGTLSHLVQSVTVVNPSGGTLSLLVQSVTVVNPSGGTLSHLVQSVTVVNPSGGTLSHLVQSVTVVNPSGGTLSHLVQSVTVVNPSGGTLSHLVHFVFISFRCWFLEPFVFSLLAKAAGISRRRPAPPVPNVILEGVYQQYGVRVPTLVLRQVCEIGQVSERQVDRWLRRRHALTRATKYDKFMDCAYDFVCHLSFCMLGVSIMYRKPWVWDITQCWAGYPHHNLTHDVWWYYMLCLAYYWSATFIHLPKPGIKLSARVQMLLHHVFTILLMVFSWTCNLVRVGSVVLVVHECADVPLLAAKLCKHAGVDGLTDALFTVFLVLWLVTRCYMYPFWVMRSVFFEATTYMFMPSAYLFMGLLTGLLVLNVVWTVLILAIVVRKLRAGTLQDYRSSGEDPSTSDADINDGKKSD